MEIDVETFSIRNDNYKKKGIKIIIQTHVTTYQFQESIHSKYH